MPSPGGDGRFLHVFNPFAILCNLCHKHLVQENGKLLLVLTGATVCSLTSTINVRPCAIGMHYKHTRRAKGVAFTPIQQAHSHVQRGMHVGCMHVAWISLNGPCAACWMQHDCDFSACTCSAGGCKKSCMRLGSPYGLLAHDPSGSKAVCSRGTSTHLEVIRLARTHRGNSLTAIAHKDGGEAAEGWFGCSLV